MKCPKCGKATIKYNQRNPRSKNGSDKVNFLRTDFTSKCKSCGYEGVA